MSKTVHSSQVDDMNQRVEMMREYRAQLAAEESRKAAEEEAARKAATPERVSTYDSENPSPEDLARVKVRGTKEDETVHNNFAKWEAGVAADAAANGGLLTPVSRPIEDTIVRLLDEPAPRTPPSDTETELNALIAECRYLMRDVACASARLTYDPDARLRFLASAQSMAAAAAEVGKTVAKLRAASAPGSQVETVRHEMVFRHERTTPSPSPCLPESSKQ